MPVLVISAVVVGFFAILMLFVNNYLKAEPNEALILTGRKYRTQITDKSGHEQVITRGWRAIVGGATLKIPVIEKVSRLSLELMNLADVKVVSAYSKEGVPVTIDAVANVKISSEEEMLARAVERFLSTPRQQIHQIIKETLEGQLRDIIGVLTVEELYQNETCSSARCSNSRAMSWPRSASSSTSSTSRTSATTGATWRPWASAARPR